VAEELVHRHKDQLDRLEVVVHNQMEGNSVELHNHLAEDSLALLHSQQVEGIQMLRHTEVAAELHRQAGEDIHTQAGEDIVEEEVHGAAQAEEGLQDAQNHQDEHDRPQVAVQGLKKSLLVQDWQASHHKGLGLVILHKTTGHKDQVVEGHMDWEVVEAHKDWELGLVIHHKTTGHKDWVVEGHKDWELVVVHTEQEDRMEKESGNHKDHMEVVWRVVVEVHKGYRQEGMEDRKDYRQGEQTVEELVAKFRKATQELEILSSFDGCLAFETGPSQYHIEHHTFVEHWRVQTATHKFDL